MAILKKSTAWNRAFLMVESADHITGLTGATVSVTLSKNGGSFATAGGSVSEIGNGWYYVGLNTTDTGTAGDLAYHCTATSGDPTDFADQVWDPAVASIGVNVENWLGTIVSTPATAGIPDINIKNVGGSTLSTTSAQIGVNVVNIAGQAATLDANNLLEVDVQDWRGNAVAATSVNGVPKVDLADILGTAVSTPATAGILDVNVKNIVNATAQIDGNNLLKVDLVDILGTIASTPATAGILDVNVKNIVNAAAQIDGNNLLKIDVVDIAGAAVNTAAAQLGVNVVDINGQTATAAAGVTFPASIASPTNITAGTITTVTNLTNAATAGDLTATMKASVQTASAAAITAAEPITANVTQWDGTGVAGAISPDTIFTHSGTAQAGGTSTITLDSGASAVNNFYQNETIYIRSGTGAGQSAVIISYVGSTKVATVGAAWATQPDNSSVFTIAAFGPSAATVSGTVSANVTEWNGSAVASPNVAGVPLVDVKYFLGTQSAGAAGYAGIDWSAIDNKTSTVDLTNTTIKNLDGNTVQTGDAYAYLGTNLGVHGAGATAITGVTLAASQPGVTIPTVTNLTNGVNVTEVNGFANAAAALAQMDQSVCWGTCSGGTTTTAVVGTLNNPSSLSDASQLIGRTIIFLGTTATAGLRGQAASINASTTGATPTISFTATPLTEAPANGDVFVVV
jgi:hypothetical protein